MITKEQIEHIVEQKLIGTTAFVVDISVRTGNNIAIYIDDENGVTIDFCAHLSRCVEEALDREVEDFSLEVSSAGLGSPFKVRKQYQKAVGKKIDVVLADGRKLSGELLSVDDEGIKILLIPSRKKKKVSIDNSIGELESTPQLRWEDIKTTKEIIKF